MKRGLTHCLLACGLILSAACSSDTDTTYFDYTFEFNIQNKRIHATLDIRNANNITLLDFNLENSLCSDFKSKSKLSSKGTRLTWSPTQHNATLSYSCDVNHEKNSKNSDVAYDAYFTDDWAIFRGDDIAPAARTRFKKGTSTRTTVEFILPKHWNGVNTGWEKELSPAFGDRHVFNVDNPERSFDRPTGWMIAGKLGTRRVKYEHDGHISRIAVSAPQSSTFRQMDTLTFLQFLWPSLTNMCGRAPEKILVVGADNPMWRGGLSAGNSFYMHADRPLVSENGTSTLVHELFHMCTRISGKESADWIAEGLAEYYSLELLHRAGGLHLDRYSRSLDTLRSWAKKAKALDSKRSTGATTAKAALIFHELNQEIKEKTRGNASLDNVVRELMVIKKIDKYDLKKAVEKLLDGPSKTLKETNLY